MSKNENVWDVFLRNIQKAEEQAIINGIETNAIVLNSDYDMCKQFFILCGFNNQNIIRVPPMILGHKLFLDRLPENYEFALTYKEDYKAEPDYRSLIIKHVRVTKSGRLVLKGLSPTKNKEDYDLIL